MADNCSSTIFKVFKVLVILVHGFQLVCNHPLLTENSNIVPPFHHSEEPYSLIPNEGWRSRSFQLSDSGSSSDIFNGDNLSDSDYRNKPESTENSRHEIPETHRRSHHRRRSAGDIGSLCSIFQTFLDARFAHCRVTNQQDDRRHDESADDSNDLSLSRVPNSPVIHGDEEMGLDHERRPTPPPPPRSNSADKRIDHDINSDEEDEQDETKISQDRTMIVVPDRPCPPGKRRDPRGYCRRVVTIRTNYPFGPPQGLRPIRYYYSRFVAVPTLHFILPNLK